MQAQQISSNETSTYRSFLDALEMAARMGHSCRMRQSGRITDSSRPPAHDHLRLAESLLRAVEDSVSSLQRLLREVHQEIDFLLRDVPESEQHQEVSSLRQEVEQLREGLVSRAVIERAKGIIMQAHAVSECQAFDLLNELSQRQHRKLRDIAADVVNGQPAPAPRANGQVSARRAGATSDQSDDAVQPEAVPRPHDVSSSHPAAPSGDPPPRSRV